MKEQRYLTLVDDYFNNVTNIYTDAGYVMGNSYGKIAYKIGNKKTKIKQIKIPTIPYLKQYTNLLELTAVVEALKNTKEKEIVIYTDSKVVYSWVKRVKNDLGRFSIFHEQLKEEINELKKNFNRFSINWVSRDYNLAGIALENYKKIPTYQKFGDKKKTEQKIMILKKELDDGFERAVENDTLTNTFNKCKIKYER